MTDEEEAELRRRMRAAWAYSGLEQEQLAERMNVSHRSLGGWLSLKGRSRVKLDIALRLADASRVPRSFMLDGWVGVASTPPELLSADLDARFKALGEKLGDDA